MQNVKDGLPRGIGNRTKNVDQKRKAIFERLTVIGARASMSKRKKSPEEHFWGTKNQEARETKCSSKFETEEGATLLALPRKKVARQGHARSETAEEAVSKGQRASGNKEKRGKKSRTSLEKERAGRWAAKVRTSLNPRSKKEDSLT